MRVFIAIELKDCIKNYIYEKQKIIKESSIRGNFSRKENFHLTLRFIGQVTEDELYRLKKVIDETVEDTKELDATLGNIGFFPTKNRKILWIGIKKGDKELKQLFYKLEENLVKHGFQREPRGFKPHITIGRQIRLNKDFEEISKSIKIDEKEILVKSISLMESTRINNKLTYVPIYSRHLNFNKELT